MQSESNLLPMKKLVNKISDCLVNFQLNRVKVNETGAISSRSLFALLSFATPLPQLQGSLVPKAPSEHKCSRAGAQTI
ncbi:hypothetical protein TNCV_2103581 [Trichonephila clavipes]|nr:hypothetical protein TNCV_2103581 [Trichonephila clavipes]